MAESRVEPTMKVVYKSKIGILSFSFFVFFATIIGICSCANLSVKNSNPQNDSRLNDEMHQTINTLRRIDNDGKLYEIDVSFDYLDADTEKIISDSGLETHEFGCTAFLTHNEEGDVISCRNFDTNHSAKTVEDIDSILVVYHTHHDDCYKSVSVADAKYLDDKTYNYRPGALDDGNSDVSAVINGVYDPLDGINEKGLTVSSLYSDLPKGEQVYSVQNPNFPTCRTGAIIRHMLDQCATVDEAINLAYKYNVRTYPGTSGIEHLFITDSSGASKIIEWRNNEIRIADTDIGTNFYQTWDDSEPHKIKTSKLYENDSQVTKTYKNYRYGYGHGYNRFDIVASTFQQYAEFENNTYSTKMSNELARNLLSIVAQQFNSNLTSITQYSVIYNAEDLTADFWLSRDFSKKYSFSIDFK